MDEPDILNAESGDKFDADASVGHHESGSKTSLDGHSHSSHSIPSPTPSRRNRTLSASERALAGPTFHGKIKNFCRQKGHGFVTPHSGGEDIFVHISDIDGDTVPKEGDEVIFKTVMMPPKMERPQAVHVQIIAMKPVKHDHWEDTSSPPP
ncbi:cold shock domain-containing protein CG9705-like [Paramacrobiotus metropolitanus]|uniref:cold shock domain-containing protein CG9705-like n=1 Tax=Paramacrobiotus metropolitanus TaxID=2943436 RepID=UPI0024463D91|nr:cold shock domain-containing protein CG9705-like [Paramacrobiotus metropolitanus]